MCVLDNFGGSKQQFDQVSFGQLHSDTLIMVGDRQASMGTGSMVTRAVNRLHSIVPL